MSYVACVVSGYGPVLALGSPAEGISVLIAPEHSVPVYFCGLDHFPPRSWLLSANTQHRQPHPKCTPIHLLNLYSPVRRMPHLGKSSQWKGRGNS